MERLSSEELFFFRHIPTDNQLRKGDFMNKNNRSKKIKKSRVPYKISTLSIGEILKAKADSGDRNAIEFIKHCRV